MTTKFYGYLWVLYALSAGILWLGNVFTMLTLVVYGFTAFGLIFTGMMCVLPGVVSHPAVRNEKLDVPAPVAKTPAMQPSAAKALTYRSV